MRFVSSSFINYSCSVFFLISLINVLSVKLKAFVLVLMRGCCNFLGDYCLTFETLEIFPYTIWFFSLLFDVPEVDIPKNLSYSS